MKALIAVLISLVFLVAPCLAECPINPQCPVHDLGMYNTGNTKTENGHMFYIYRCPQGDEYEIRCD